MSTNNLFRTANQGVGTVPVMGIGENVKKYRELADDMSQAELAKRIGAKSQNTIAALESGKTKKTKFLPEIARELKVPISYLDPDIASGEPRIIPKKDLIGLRDLDVYVSVEGGDGQVVISQEPVETVRRPEPLATVKDGYGVIVVGESMSPLLRQGDTALFHPHKPPQVEDICMFFAEKHGDFKATIKEYRGQTKDLWKVRRYQPEMSDFTLKKKDWPNLHVVVGIYKRR